MANFLSFFLSGERRARTEWRARELIGATETILSWNDKDETPDVLFQEDTPTDFKFNLFGKIQTNHIFLMGHSYGGATVLTAAHFRPDLVEENGGVIAHEPAVDWMPDEARRSLLPWDRLQGLEAAQNFTGGTGGLEYHANTTTTESTEAGSAENKSTTTSAESPPLESTLTVHELNLIILYSGQWRNLVSISITLPLRCRQRMSLVTCVNQVSFFL